MAPTPQGDKTGPPESGYEEAETVAQLIGACQGAMACVAARAASHSAAPRTGFFEETRDMLIVRVPCISM